MTKKDAGTQRAEEQRGREAEEKRAALRNYFPSAPKQLKMQNAKFLIFNRRAEICDARASFNWERSDSPHQENLCTEDLLTPSPPQFSPLPLLVKKS
ncbi:MAG: hypothetical protein BRC49_13195 [Cyanobacteria bacterium SW_10_48_33]|nr:MAG: hypothetical protein BRC54_13665 [Cyanobacteria bacterium SW_7_48_12]PSP09321.1 MAG: hypothetical protein BRC49_13195 [Cyanobacteria bacterium SW_10_48_33]